MPHFKIQRRATCLNTLGLFLVAFQCGAATVIEDFSTTPEVRGWQTFGDTNLFRWNWVESNLAVRWDSSRTNSYFYLDLKTVLSKADDFGLAFDLVLHDYSTGTTPDKFYTFPVAIGFLNLNNAFESTFARGSGVDAVHGPRNLVEFDFFPAFNVFLPTIAQVVVSTNNSWLFDHNNLLDMPPGDLFHIEMDYSASDATLTTKTMRNGSPYGEPQAIRVPENFDFRLNSLSISSYSDQEADGSILANGTVDNVVFTVPDPPLTRISGHLEGSVRIVEFRTAANWMYTLQRSTDLADWTEIGAVAGSGETVRLEDHNAPGGHAFYRVRAERP